MKFLTLSIFIFSHDWSCRSSNVNEEEDFFSFFLQHKTTYCDGPLKRKKKLKHYTLLSGGRHLQKRKGDDFYGLDNFGGCFHLFQVSDTITSTFRRTLKQEIGQDPDIHCLCDGTRSPRFFFSYGHKTFLIFVK